MAALPDTVRYARNRARYYASRLQKLEFACGEPDLLAQLPILHEGDLIDAGPTLRCHDEFPAFLIFSGGTSGRPKVFFGGNDDLLPRGRVRNRQAPVDLRLAVTGGRHGFVPNVPGDHDSLQLPLLDTPGFEYALDVLRSEHCFDGATARVRSMTIATRTAKKLTHFLLERGVARKQLALEHVTTYGWFLSGPWRALMEVTLGCQLVDVYGFTEIFYAHAVECGACRWLHYGPEVLWEVVHPQSASSVTTGYGQLLVTNLLPRARSRVLLRYAPGDVVEIGPYCEKAGEHGLRPRGRLAHTFWVGSNGSARLVLAPTAIAEYLDSQALVGRLREPRFDRVTSTDDDAFPKWSWRAGSESESMLTLSIELKTSPALHGGAARRLADGLLDHLMADPGPFASAVRERLVEPRIDCRPPGGIPEREVIRC